MEEKDREEFLYCDKRHCPHRECLRHNRNIPFEVFVKVEKFKPDKEWNCKDILL